MNPFSGLYKKKILVNEPVGGLTKGVVSDLNKVAGASQAVGEGLSSAGNSVAELSEQLPSIEDTFHKDPLTYESFKDHLLSQELQNKAEKIDKIRKDVNQKYVNWRSGLFGGTSQAQAEEKKDSTGGGAGLGGSGGTGGEPGATEQPKEKNLLENLYGAAWGDRTPIQKLGILGILGHMATSGTPESKFNYLNFAGGAAEGAEKQMQLNQKYEEEAKNEQKKLDAAKANASSNEITPDDAKVWNSFLKVYAPNGIAFLDKSQLQSYLSPEEKKRFKNAQPGELLSYIASRQGVGATAEKYGFGYTGGTNQVNAQPKQPGEVQSDSKGQKWEIVRDASGKPIGKKRI